MKTHVRCGTLFSAGDQEGRPGQTLVHDEHGILEFVGPTEQAPKVDRSLPGVNESPPATPPKPKINPFSVDNLLKSLGGG